jgi:acetoin utilization deacetylase AcuC-like enzyme
MSRKTGIVKDQKYLLHGANLDHPESPLRLEAIYDMLERPDMEGHFIDIAPRYATPEEIGMVHGTQYIELVASTAGKAHQYLDPDTETTPESYDVARLAVGGVCNAIEGVISGTVDNAFALVRPPGHHAGFHEAAGFCLFNNIAVGAMSAIHHHGMKRILIVDWDLHHGNGTQEIFYEDRRVLYFSTHQYPAYPGTGGISEIGSGAGMGYTINVPLRLGTDDAQYVRVFRKILLPVALKFKPEMILVSAGFDIHHKDPLGGMRVTPEGFACLMRILLDIADACCGGKLAVTLEGGYHIAGLTASTRAVLKEMIDETRVSEEELEQQDRQADPRIDPVIERVIDQITPMWRVF